MKIYKILLKVQRHSFVKIHSECFTLYANLKLIFRRIKNKNRRYYCLLSQKKIFILIRLCIAYTTDHIRTHNIRYLAPLSSGLCGDHSRVLFSVLFTT